MRLLLTRGFCAVWFSLVGVSSCGEAEDVGGCVPGASAACACTNGDTGAQVCQKDGSFGACVCAPDGSGGDGNAGGASEGGAGATMSASGGTSGRGGGGTTGGRINASGGKGVVAGASGADGGTDAGSGGAPPCPIAETEWCDDFDNDCDGVVDNGEVCPDDSVANTDPFAEGVYLLGTTAEGSCGADALQRFWPTLATTYHAGFDCYADTFVFRPTDGAIFYSATFSGLLEDVPTGADPLVETPPCGESASAGHANANFGFDGNDVLHYQCADTVRRGNGELVAQSIKRLVAVLADGRTIVSRASTGTAGSDDFVVLSSKGEELSRLNPRSEFVGTLTPDFRSVTVSENRAYVAFQRTYGQDGREAVAYRLDEQSAWQRIRRVSLPGFGKWMLVISDGTIFIRDADRLTTFDDQIRAFKPDGTEAIVWREADQTAVRSHIGDQLLVGPR